MQYSASETGSVSILRWKCGEAPAHLSRYLPSLSPKDEQIHFPKRCEVVDKVQKLSSPKCSTSSFEPISIDSEWQEILEIPWDVGGKDMSLFLKCKSWEILNSSCSFLTNHIITNEKLSYVLHKCALFAVKFFVFNITFF